MSTTPAQIGSPGLWIGFSSFVLAALLLDFFIFHRKSQVVPIKQALGWVTLWVAVAMASMVALRLRALGR